IVFIVFSIQTGYTSISSMHISDAIVEELLKDSSNLSEDKLEEIRHQVATSKRSWQDIVLQRSVLSEAALTQAYADYSGTPYVEINPKDSQNEVRKRIPERSARQYKAIL